MDAEIDKPKTVADFRRIAAPILRTLAREVMGKNPRKSTIAKQRYDLVQSSLSHMASLEAAGISRRAEILNLQGQVKALSGVISSGSKVIIARKTDEKPEAIQGVKEGGKQ